LPPRWAPTREIVDGEREGGQVKRAGREEGTHVRGGDERKRMRDRERQRERERSGARERKRQV